MPQPDVNDLFPAKSTDELFPADVSNQNYRRQTLGTSPVQDLIFGNTEVNPIARVLDHFGQGFKQSWGSSQENLSKETEDTLKVNKLFDGWNEGKSSIVKAANDSLFRPAAVQLVKEVHDAEALGRAASGLFTGAQAAVAQIGEETGHPQIGREIAAIPEAFMGTPHPTGMPAAPKYARAIPDLPKAAELKVIGAGEDGYFGTAPSETQTVLSIKGTNFEAPLKDQGMPTDLFAEPRDASVGVVPVKEAPVELGLPAAAEAAPANPIAADVTQKLVAAGRPEAEAQASGELIASHYEARAERFGGERGTPEQMYVNEGADIRSGDGAPAKSGPIKPPEGDTAEAVTPTTPTLDGGAAEPIKTVPELKKALRGRAAADPQTWSLYEFLAKEGGLKPTADLQSIMGGKNPFVPGFGPLMRKGGLTMDEALTRAKENAYVLDPNDIQHTPGAANTGELTKSVNDLHDMIAEESRGRKNYRNDHTPKEKAVNPEEERTSILDALHREVKAAGGKVDPALEDRVVEIVQKEGISDVHDAYERAIMEEHDRHEGLLNDRRNTKETAQIIGHDAPDSGAAPHSLQEFVDDIGYTWASEQEARAANVGEPQGHGANDRSAELELNQTGTLERKLADGVYVSGSKAVVDGAPREGFIRDIASSNIDVPTVKQLDHAIKATQEGEKKFALASGFSAEQEARMRTLNRQIDEGGLAADEAIKEKKTILDSVPDNGLDLDIADVDSLKKLKLEFGSLERTGTETQAEYEDGVARVLKRYISQLTSGDDFAKAVFRKAFVEAQKHGIDTKALGNDVIDRFLGDLSLSDQEFMRKEFAGFLAPKIADRSFDQIKRGKINLRKDAKPIITLFKEANASTFIHETGHAWLEELMKDSEHPLAPSDLKTDAATVRDWLGVKGEKAPPPKPGMIRFYHGTAYTEASDFTGKTFVTPHFEYARDYHGGPNNVLYTDFTKAEADAKGLIDEVNRYPINGSIDDGASRLQPLEKAGDIKTSHHEKFARGFERYMMEGKAPNQALANVFAKFKDWLTKIYQTVNRLKSPINDEIRGVFDRLLTMHPSEVKIEPEGPAKTFADIHEADALNTPAEMAHPAAETIQAERDSVAARHIPEDQNARLKGTPDQARRSEAGNLKPAGDAVAAEPVAGEAGNPEASGAVGAGGTQATPEGARAPKEAPVTAHDKFPEKAGNIRLDNLNTPEDLNAIIRQTAEDNGDFQNVRGPVSDAQVLDLAEAAGVDAAFIDSKKLGEAWTAPQIVALRRLLIQSAQSVHELALKAAGGAEADVMAYAQAKARHQLIQERVSSVTAEAGRALRAFQSKFTDGVAGDVSAFLKEATGKTLFQLQQEAKFLSKLQTAGQTSRFVNDTAKGTFRNAILEYYINALISGPVTHSRYMVSNAINALWTPLVEIPLASAVGKARELATGAPVERVHLGEAGAQLYGMIKGSRDGLSAAIEAFKTGVSPALPKEQVSAHFAEASHAIPGPIGQILRLPSRSVAGIHSFFKAVRYEQNVQSLAYREAANEGLTGEAFSNRVAELTTSPTEAMMTDATNNALKELYMSPTEYHSKMGGLVRFTNQNLAAKIVVPFMKIGSQITRNAFMERTPLGILDKKVRADLSSNSAAADFQAAKITGGVALMATSVGLCAEGMMTGDGPEDPAARSVWLLSHTPASIQIGDVTFKYGNTGPLGMLMRFAANTYETAHGMGDKDMGTLAVSFFEGFAKSVLDETFLRGVKDALDAMFHPKEYGGRYLKSQITNWMPWSVGMSQVARKVDPFQRETHGIFQAAQAKIPWLSKDLMPRRDMFGEPMPNGGPIPDYASDPVVKAMDDLHLGIGKIGKKIRGVDLTEQQYDDLSRVAGRMAKARLNAIVNIINNPNVPPGQRIEMIHTAISSSRETARSLILMQNPEIIKQATDAKISKLRGTETAH